MIIKEVNGNAISMFLNGEGHLIHGCNCFCAMGKGIALEVKRRIPGAYKVDQNTRSGDKGKLGKLSVYEHDNGLLLFNAYTQYDYKGAGPKVDYRAIRSAFQSAVILSQEKSKNSPHIPIITPLIGAGYAGGDWDKIRSIIDSVTVLHPVIVVHYDPKAR